MLGQGRQGDQPSRELGEIFYRGNNLWLNWLHSTNFPTWLGRKTLGRLLRDARPSKTHVQKGTTISNSNIIVWFCLFQQHDIVCLRLLLSTLYFWDSSVLLHVHFHCCVVTDKNVDCCQRWAIMNTFVYVIWYIRAYNPVRYICKIRTGLIIMTRDRGWKGKYIIKQSERGVRAVLIKVSLRRCHLSRDLTEENSWIGEEELHHRMTGTLNWGQGTKSSGSPKQREFAGESCTKRELWRSAEGPPWVSDEYLSAQACEETVWDWRKKQLKRSKVDLFHAGLNTVLVLINQTWTSQLMMH